MSCYFIQRHSKSASPSQQEKKVLSTGWIYRVPTKVERRKVEKTLPDGRVVKKWSRFVTGTDIEIPKPKPKYDDRGGGNDIGER